MWKCQSLSHVPLFATPLATIRQAPLSNEFSRQVYWSGLPFPSWGDILDSGIKPGSSTLRPLRKPHTYDRRIKKRLIKHMFCFFFLWWILSYIEMKQPWVYMCFPSQSPLPPPSPPVPSRFSQCTRSERLSHASNLGWWSVSP